jgi:hypothetical protein
MYRLNPQYNIKPIKKQAKTFLLNTAELELVRSPRFEPGSSAWQADVLDQTRPRPHIHAFLWSSDQCRRLYRLLVACQSS